MVLRDGSLSAEKALSSESRPRELTTTEERRSWSKQSLWEQLDGDPVQAFCQAWQNRKRYAYTKDEVLSNEIASCLARWVSRTGVLYE
jgi:hypothetical protein